MGCDIHLYIEFKNKKVESDGHKDNWHSFGKRINPGRNYALFALMADVRNYDGQLPVIFEPRGMPDDAGYYSSDDNRIYISENTGDGERTVTMERAKQWVESESSKFVYGVNSETVPVWVTDPDAHSHSWLTTNEFETILNKYIELETGWHKERVDQHTKMVAKQNIQPTSWAFEPPAMNIEPQYQVVLASMKRFEELGYDARIVFWFDN